MDELQRDLFDDTTYYYSLIGDIWNLGNLRDTLKEGDTFEGGGKTWFILGRSNADLTFTIMEESVFRKGVSEKMGKAMAKERIEYILRELLEYKDCVSSSNAVHMDGHLYEDVVKDIETYLELNNE
tara:strand:- start:62 stop:439 length:378 start_codon:yes stop_codon:yes gene_type:complete